MVTASIHFTCVERRISLRCPEGPTADLLRINFEAMKSRPSAPHLAYQIREERGGSLRLSRSGSPFAATAADLGELIYLLESDLVIQVQLLRPDLVFVHAAALEWKGRVYLLVGPSGAGKSTTCWGLLAHGFRYLSDELAPISPRSASVVGYPHALNMKRDPPAGFGVSRAARRTSRGIHLPLPRELVHPPHRPLPLGGIFFVSYDAATQRPGVRGVTRGEAAARLYPHILNALAHREDGLSAAVAVAASVPAFTLDASSLAETCEAVQRCVASISR